MRLEVEVIGRGEEREKWKETHHRTAKVALTGGTAVHRGHSPAAARVLFVTPPVELQSSRCVFQIRGRFDRGGQHETLIPILACCVFLSWSVRWLIQVYACTINKELVQWVDSSLRKKVG